ncbi:MAG: serine/threonine-protein phosphatase [Leptospiraceae bacterium]|nr:serine/threonine-protein phosphatase [Leptospiraceae bacterium]MCP5512038.1 serine/threonine-protein phosphatase [Leptospiraceae bacterium]
MLKNISTKLSEKGYLTSRYFLLFIAYFGFLLLCFLTGIITDDIFYWVSLTLLTFFILVNLVFAAAKPDRESLVGNTYSDDESDEHFIKKNHILQTLVYPEDIHDSVFEASSRSLPHSLFGGDLVFQIKDKKGNYWFAIGDSSGHDLNSHLFSMMILSQLNFLVNVCNSPREVNRRLNESLKLKIESNKLNIFSYASLAIFKSDADGNFIHYGQHPNMILHRFSTKENETIETAGDFIGLDISKSGSDEEEGVFKMEKGDVLFAFTDGVFEQKNHQNKYFGFKLYEFIKNEDKMNLKKLTEKLFEEIQIFTESKINDDMSILVIRKK